MGGSSSDEKRSENGKLLTCNPFSMKKIYCEILSPFLSVAIFPNELVKKT